MDRSTTDARDILLFLFIPYVFSGSTWGNAVIYLFPSLMVLHAAPRHPELLGRHVPLAALTGILGLALAAAGSRRIALLLRGAL
jgi:hypothetical protein